MTVKPVSLKPSLLFNGIIWSQKYNCIPSHEDFYGGLQINLINLPQLNHV